jgi:ribose-phosphate pyrophosphokinase
VISACKIGSANRITAVTPLFPYSRQPDLAWDRAGAPLSKPYVDVPRDNYTFESVPVTPGPNIPKTASLGNGADLSRLFNKTKIANGAGDSVYHAHGGGLGMDQASNRAHSGSVTGSDPGYYSADSDAVEKQTLFDAVEAKTGYKRWVAQAGNLVADLLTCAGADQ